MITFALNSSNKRTRQPQERAVYWRNSDTDAAVTRAGAEAPDPGSAKAEGHHVEA